MKIAVVGPSPVPYTIGGMEKLLWQMTEKINQLTPHQAELIKLPSREHDFWSLIDSYYQFSQLDLSHFDLVISTKYPSWMVQHPNQVCYMIHKLRGLYDTYHFTGMPLEVQSNCSATKQLMHFLDSTWARPNTNRFWDEINQFKQQRQQVPSADLAFPGPLIRKIIHYLDNAALQPAKIKRYCTMSQTVAKRENYFPTGVEVAIANPPPANDLAGNISYGNYFFTVSRLDNAKRVSLLVEAMKKVTGDVKLVIAGTGPAEQELKALAKDDDRIQFKGYCSDEVVSQLYANCLAVLYVPYDEDYGLVTLEAYLRKKPVVTCVDSGGTTEFVVNRKNGFITQPDPASLAEAMQYIVDHANEAANMGVIGLQNINHVNWDNFVQTIIPREQKLAKKPLPTSERKKIVVTTTFPIYPPRGGGQSRVYHLYKEVAKKYDVEILTLANFDQQFFYGQIAPGMKEIRLPKSASHHEKEEELYQKAGVPITDATMPQLSRYTPLYGQTLAQRVKEADIVVLSHPYLYDEVANSETTAALVLEAQDVEYDLKSAVLTDQVADLLTEVHRVEKASCNHSKLIITCSTADAKRLNELYNVDPNKFIVTPNGVDMSNVPFISINERKTNKTKAGLANENLALFVGSWHPPNLEACNIIFKVAERLPDVKFLLLGSQCLAFKHQAVPPNVAMLGVVDDAEKNHLYSIADIALNPMISGSGTNLKMFDYMAAGMPVISTEFGARGTNAVNGEHLIICQPNEMAEQITMLLNKDSAAIEKITQQAYQLVKDNFDWSSIAAPLIKKLDEILA